MSTRLGTATAQRKAKGSLLFSSTLLIVLSFYLPFLCQSKLCCVDIYLTWRGKMVSSSLLFLIHYLLFCISNLLTYCGTLVDQVVILTTCLYSRMMALAARLPKGDGLFLFRERTNGLNQVTLCGSFSA